MTITDNPTVDNGVNVEALLGARDAFGQMPEAAQFQWRASTRWVNGTHTRTTVTDFFGEMAIFQREKRMATVRARGEVRVLTVDRPRW